jgi:hypothetical protein
MSKSTRDMLAVTAIAVIGLFFLAAVLIDRGATREDEIQRYRLCLEKGGSWFSVRGGECSVLRKGD